MAKQRKTGHIKVREEKIRLPSGTQTVLTTYLLKQEYAKDVSKYIGYLEGYDGSFEGPSERAVYEAAREYLESLEKPEVEKVIRIFWDYAKGGAAVSHNIADPGVLIAMEYYVLMKVTVKVNFGGKESEKTIYYSESAWAHMQELIAEGVTKTIDTRHGDERVDDPWFGSINPHDSGDIPWSPELEASLQELQTRLRMLGERLTEVVTNVDKMKEIGAAIVRLLPAGPSEDTDGKT